MKRWYKNPIIIGLILASIGWFSYITRNAILSEGSASESMVKLEDKRIEARIDSNQKLVDQQISQVCGAVSEIKGIIQEHEKSQKEQIDGIYKLLIKSARESKARDDKKYN